MQIRSKTYVKVLAPVLFAGLAVLLLVLPLRAGGIMQGQTEQGYRFMSGGVGDDERNEMMQRANQYDLTLSFAAYSGHYLSDVNVVVTDQRGKEMINTMTTGPLFYADLPAGKYDIKATFNGQTQQIKNVQISNARRFSRLLHWNASDDQIVER
jgi:hypothetical protein